MENASDLQHFHYVHQELIPHITSLKFLFDSSDGTETEHTITSKMTIYFLGVELVTVPIKLCHVSPVTELLYIGTEDLMLGPIDSDAVIMVNSLKLQRSILTRNDEAMVRWRRFCQKFYTKKLVSS
ncbi:unnamed protein product, partial [Medioppia subpectinata]